MSAAVDVIDRLTPTARPSEPELRALAEPWAGWRSYYSFYLWFTLAPGLGSSE